MLIEAYLCDVETSYILIVIEVMSQATDSRYVVCTICSAEELHGPTAVSSVVLADELRLQRFRGRFPANSTAE